jgi:hypothetical protein
MKQIFITVKNGRDTYDKNMMDSSSEERTNWYNTLSKVQISSVLEQFVTYEIKKENHS